MKNLIIFPLIILLILAVRLALFYSHPPLLHDHQHVSFSTTLLSDPKISGNSQQFTAKYGNFWYFTNVKIVAQQFPSFTYGNYLTIDGTVKNIFPQQNFQGKNSGSSASTTTGKAPSNVKPVLTISFPKIMLDLSKQNTFLLFLNGFRGRMRDFYEQTLPATSASLLLGIVFGIAQNLPKDFQTNLQSTGLTHVVAASGMNVTMVGGFLLGVLGIVGGLLKRQLLLFLVIVGLALYATLSGLQASILRATLMFGSVLLAQALGRQYSAFYILTIVGAVMLFLNPLLVSDVGFLLSFFSTIGIIFIQPILHFSNIISDDIKTTASAQLATVPILLTTFGQYSLLSLLTNALVLWTIPPLMVLGGVGALIALVFEPLGKIFIYLCFPFLLFFEWIVTFFGSLHWSLTATNIPLQFIFGYYLILLSVVLVLRRHQRKHIDPLSHGHIVDNETIEQ